MTWIRRSDRWHRNFLALFLFLSVPTIAMSQQKPAPKPAPAKPAPAAKPAAPAKPAPHPATGGSAAATRTPAAAGSKTGTAAGAHTTTAAGARTNNTAGAKTNTTVGGKTNTTAAAGRTNTAAGAKTNTTAAAKPGAMVAKTSATPKGGVAKAGVNGSTHNFNAAGKRTSVETKSGTRANFDRGGRVSTIHTKNGMTINHGAHGERRFETRRRDGGRVVGYGHGRGFAEHGYYRGGHPYMRRTYYYGGRRYAYAYRGYYYGGRPYYGYVPPAYYGPAYYGWAYNPWPAPVAYGWGWGGAPWYGYNSYYFAPAPVYPYPALWLTDYLLAANLQAAYEARAAAEGASLSGPESEYRTLNGGGGDEAPAPMSPEMKQEIAEEIKSQINAEKEAAAHPEPAGAVSSTAPSGEQTGPDELPAALDPAHRIFIVSQVVSSSNEDGTECSLSPGDVLKRIDDKPDGDQNVKVLVAKSQKDDCATGSKVPVAVQDLQDMHNDFRAKIDEGLGKLAENQGKNGIPSGPPAASKPNPAGQAQPDLTVESDLKSQVDEAGQAEKEVQDAAPPNGGSDD